MARPRKQFDLKEVRKLAGEGATGEEIAFRLGTAPETISRHKGKYVEFRQALKDGAVDLQCSLKRVVIQLARGYKYKDENTGKLVHVQPNVTALIWATKNFCGWTDRQEVAHAGSIGITFDDLIKASFNGRNNANNAGAGIPGRITSLS